MILALTVNLCVEVVQVYLYHEWSKVIENLYTHVAVVLILHRKMSDLSSYRKPLYRCLLFYLILQI